MKNISLAVVLTAFVFIACNSNTDKKETKTEQESTGSEQLYACPMHPEVTGKKGEKCSKCDMNLTEPVTLPVENKSDTSKPSSAVTPSDFSIREIVSAYLKLKNALFKDDSKTAAAAGNEMLVKLTELNVAVLPAANKQVVTDIAEDAKEHAEHIGANAGKIGHQREHFATLSKDVKDLIETFGSEQKLYQDFCPMYNGGKGAAWISETKEIRNPYYGSKMPDCGSITKEL